MCTTTNIYLNYYAQDFYNTYIIKMSEPKKVQRMSILLHDKIKDEREEYFA